MTLASAILYTTLQVGELGALAGIAMVPRTIQKALSTMKLKERLSSPHAPEKIVWTDEDPFEIKSPPADLPEPEETLRQAKAWLRERFRNGLDSDCACCGQRVVKYRRSISGQMVKALAYAATQDGVTPKAMSKLQGGCGDYGKLRFWGFLDKGDDNKWRTTERGRQFLRGTVTGAKYVYVFNDTAFGRSEEQVYVADCAGKEFHFAEIMDVPAETGKAA